MKTGRSSAYTPNFRVPGERGQGYLVHASSVARVRLRPAEAPGRVDGLGLQPGQHPQRLRVALEASARLGQLVQRVLAVVTERRVAQVVGQRGGLGDVRLRAQRPRQVPRDLGHLEAVGEPVADEVVHLRPVHLGLGGQPPRGRRVHDAGAVALVRRPLRRLDPLGRLGDQPLAVVLVVQLGAVHQAPTLATARRQ